MADQKKIPGTFMLFKQQVKEGSNRPPFSGFITDHNGKEFKIDGWLRKKKNGDWYIAGRFYTHEQAQKDLKVDKPDESDDLHDLPI